jgi:RNA-binding protein
MSMRGKDRAALRAEAHHLDVVVHVGQSGITPTLLGSVDDVLRTRELIKAQVPKGGELSAREAAESIAPQVKAEIVQVIGRTFTLYRENPELKRGELPPWRR